LQSHPTTISNLVDETIFIVKESLICLNRLRFLFTSSVLNLAELVAIRPDLAHTKKLVYFHENQLTYPVRKESTRNKRQIECKEQRDFQYGYNQVLTSLTADRIIFNSSFNMNSFLQNISSFLNQTPDYHVKLNIKGEILPKCSVSYFPININKEFIESIQVETAMNQMLIYMDYESYLSMVSLIAL